MSTQPSDSAALFFDTALPKWIFLQLLDDCNLRCKMCYEWGLNGPYRQKSTLKKLDFGVVREIVAECKPARPFYELYGGEPLLYPEIAQVLRLVVDAGSKVQFPTNGTLLENYVDVLVETPPETIWVSLDGPREINDRQRGHGVFDKAVRGIEKLFELRQRRGQKLPRIGIGMCITPLNYSFIEEFLLESLDIRKLDCISLELQSYLTGKTHRDYEDVLQQHFGVLNAPLARGFIRDTSSFASIDCDSIARQIATIADRCRNEGRYLNLYPRSMTAENIRKYFSAEWFSMSDAKKRCSFPWISTEVSASGDVTSCHAFHDLSLGNVNQSSIGTIWRGEPYAKYRKYLRKHLFPICPSCCLFYNEKPPSDFLR